MSRGAASHVKRLKRLDARRVWHPYTQMSEYEARDSVIVARARGMRVQDVEGRWYWDAVSSIWLNVHGHRSAPLDRALKAQVDRVAHTTLLGQGNVPSVELADRLAAHAPKGLGRVFYSDNGSCANEAAFRMASLHWRRKGRPRKRRFLTFEGAYHGDTLATVAVAPVPTFHQEILEDLPPALQAPFPTCDDHQRGACRDEHLSAVEDVLRAHAKETAALLVEPMVQFVGGVRVMPPGFLRGLRDLADRHDVLLIADEVATGFGRTGRLWACDHEAVRPDLMTVGKGLTGGYLPLAATLASEDVFGSFLGRYEERRTLFYGHSFTGNQLGCAVALASLDRLLRMLPALPEKAAWLARRLEGFRDLPFVGSVRSFGFAAAVETFADPATRRPFAWEQRAGWLVADRARALGLLTRPLGSNTMFVPPIAASRRDLDAMLSILRRAHEDVAPTLDRLAAQRPRRLVEATA